MLAARSASTRRSDDSRAPHFIETIRRRGYRLIAKVSFPDDYCRAAVQTAAWADRCPYLGLSAFGGEHVSVFFGRSKMTAELVAKKRKQVENQRRFVLMVGASGCGKTSLLQAGAIPLFCQDGGFGGLHWLSGAMKLGQTAYKMRSVRVFRPALFANDD